MSGYDFRSVESKWKEKYGRYKAYKGLDFDDKKEKFYMLTEFPYPSGSGLHVGHAFSMTGADVYARFQRMNGKNVMFPMGWDAFGLPAENYAIKTGIKPQVTTREVVLKFKEQMDRLGFSFDWDREVNTTLPDYYKWTQWIFIKLVEKGLASKQEMPINWCPSCKIGLANEEVINGNCERCGTKTEKRTISQWVVRITAYADRLIEGLKDTEFIEKVKAAQINWIDRREGAKIKFVLTNQNLSIKEVEVFTSRPDTLEGATFLVVAPEHALAEIARKTESEFASEIGRYSSEVREKSEIDRMDESREKTGVFSGIYAVNPITQKNIPIWIADYVTMGYGTGAIMGVPSHDERDGAFASKFNLQVNESYAPDATMIEKIKKMGVGEESVTYHLRDWIFSRQHYWGEPIPMVYCDRDGWVCVPEEQLPVELPEVEKYQPTDTGESPLANIREWVETSCPKCGGGARRETDTMPNWAGSDWYFLRYCDPKNEERLADIDKMEYWLPVDVYTGGDEHNTLHLLYSRFIYQFLWDLGVVPKKYPEPYKKRLSHGVILGPDGNRMSKSKGNIIEPGTVAEVYGSDAVRTYMMFMGPFDATMAWNERSLVGVKRFIEKFYRLITEKAVKKEVADEGSLRLVHRLIKKVGDDVAAFKFNTAIAKMMEATNKLLDESANLSDKELSVLVRLMAPFAPFVSEELWFKLGNEFSVHSSQFPSYEDKYLVEEKATLAVQINGKLRGTVEMDMNSTEDEVVNEVKGIEKISKYLAGLDIKRVVYVKGRTINFVVG